METNKKILDLARELYNEGEITKKQLLETYFYQNIKKIDFTKYRL